MHVGLQAQRPFSALQQTEATICRKNFIKPAQNNIPQRNTKTCVSAAVSVRSSFSLHLFVLVRQPPVGQGLIIHEVSRSHTKTHHSRQDSSGRVNSSSQRLRDNTQHLQETDIHAPGGIRTYNLSWRVMAELRLRPSGHWDRHNCHIPT